MATWRRRFSSSREKGLRASELKSGRAASEGLVIFIYSSRQSNRRVGGEINCETDFVARTDQFQNLAKEIAMQIAAAKPKYVSKEDVPESVLDSEKAILRTQDP